MFVGGVASRYQREVATVGGPIRMAVSCQSRSTPNAAKPGAMRPMGMSWKLALQRMRGQLLKPELIEDEYWLMPHDPPIGPYATKAEALDDLRGINRFYKLVEKEDRDDSENLSIDDILS